MDGQESSNTEDEKGKQDKKKKRAKPKTKPEKPPKAEKIKQETQTITFAKGEFIICFED